VTARKPLPGILACILALSGCVSGGGNSGSETTNGLTGTVRDLEGRPIPGARVRLLTGDYNPVESPAPPTTTTGAKGAYAFSDVAPGAYNLEVSDSAHGALALVPGVVVPSEGSGVADGTLGKPGRLDARVGDFVGEGETGYVYIPGTGAYVALDDSARASGTAELPQVPVGRYDALLLIVKDGGDRRSITLAHDFEVLSETTSAAEPFQTWKYSRDIVFDAKAMGVSGTVAGFPLLVRLTGANFDFAQAQPNGQDVRFADGDGKALPYQIERWDADAKRAELWVRLDTVRAESRRIVMRWGRAGASAAPPGPAVFASEAGFASVYHLDEAANDDPGGYRDATPSANHATAAELNPGAQVPGIIGTATAFAGGPLSLKGTLTAGVPKGFGGNAGWTVSFWIRCDLVPQRQNILDFGKPGTQTDVHFLVHADTMAQFGAFDGGASRTDPAPWQEYFRIAPIVGRWAYVATVYDADKATLATYVDGALADSITTSPMAVDSLGGLRIGRQLPTHPQDSPFNGVLDEIRFIARPLSGDRIKLDYATQKP
jgi:hypothetical protein